ncbi:MAG: hypothetical protein HS128_17775 [Ideonella sp.]|nr:hypothetical protein [Ideonella sp.]MCC7459416.1 hypothetical protein [Nitrospira sp.]
MQPITDLYIELAERIARRLGAPRVRALHLPPATGTKEAEFCALELDDGSIGFSYIQLEGTEAPLREQHRARSLAGTEALALARGFAATGDAVARALGFAAINALSQQLFARSGWVPPAGGDPLGAIDPQRGEHIGMIGLFTPLVPAIARAGARLTVLELKAALVRDEPQLRVTTDPAELATCEKVVSTCTVILNDTLDAVLAACRTARHFAIVGPTAGCVPDPLFTRGVHTLGGRRVVDRERFLHAFGSGGKWGAHATKTVIARDDYPGIDRLLAAVR